MKREQLTEKLLDIKRARGWSWKYITGEIGGMSPVLVVGALLGQMKLPKLLAEKAATLFDLSEVEQRMLNEVPTRGTPMPPTDPLLYRFYELVMASCQPSTSILPLTGYPIPGAIVCRSRCLESSSRTSTTETRQAYPITATKRNDDSTHSSPRQAWSHPTRSPEGVES